MTDATSGIEIDWVGGNCPVQAEGTIDGKRFYFRARHRHWRIEIHPTATGDYLSWPDHDTAFYHDEPWGDGPYDAGWMPEETAREMIARGAEIFRATTDQRTPPERIRVAQDADGFWTCREAVSGSQEYVRSDLYKQAVRALEDVLGHTRNAGNGNAIVAERVIERIEETASQALSATRNEEASS